MLLGVSGQMPHPVRVAVDGPSCADPGWLALAVARCLRELGCAAIVVATSSFWRDASVRLEHGHADVDGYFDGWLDAVALTREVLTPLGPGGSRRYLPALRDPVSNRSVHAAYGTMPERGVLLVAGDLLLGRGLEFDLTVHLALSPAARARRTGSDQQWALAALDRYDRSVDPAGIADVVVRWDDPARPALRL